MGRSGFARTIYVWAEWWDVIVGVRSLGLQFPLRLVLGGVRYLGDFFNGGITGFVVRLFRIGRCVCVSSVWSASGIDVPGKGCV